MIETDIGVYLPAASGTVGYVAALIKHPSGAAMTERHVVTLDVADLD